MHTFKGQERKEAEEKNEHQEEDQESSASENKQWEISRRRGYQQCWILTVERSNRMKLENRPIKSDSWEVIM